MRSLLFILILGCIFTLLPHLLYLLLKVVSLLFNFRLSYRPFGIAALIVLLVWLLTGLYGNVFGRFQFEFIHFDYSNPRIPPSFEGYKIVQISDLHLDGWAGHEDKLSKIVDSINALRPNLICFTGDLVSLSSDEIQPFVPILKRLKASDGVISILGNHDYLPYKRGVSNKERSMAVNNIIDMERLDLGWRLLLNEHFVIRQPQGDSIAIIGCENQSSGFHPVIQRGCLDEASKGTDGMFRILLTHDPSHWRHEVVKDTDIPLTLSGHTHAMQLRLFGWTPSGWFYPECNGRYDDGEQTLYVNIGLGGTLPMRIGATPEITLITLKSAQ